MTSRIAGRAVIETGLSDRSSARSVAQAGLDEPVSHIPDRGEGGDVRVAAHDGLPVAGRAR